MPFCTYSISLNYDPSQITSMLILIMRYKSLKVINLTAFYFITIEKENTVHNICNCKTRKWKEKCIAVRAKTHPVILQDQTDKFDKAKEKNNPCLIGRIKDAHTPLQISTLAPRAIYPGKRRFVNKGSFVYPMERSSFLLRRIRAANLDHVACNVIKTGSLKRV